jgi:L-lysine 2,3-aminomutase
MTIDPSALPMPTRASWQRQLRDAVRDVAELAALLDLPVDAVASERAARDFSLLVPHAYLARMRKGDPRDPLLLQILPTALETLEVAGFTADPLDESEFAAGGVVRKYRGRSLLITTGACPVHCRYCFRRAFPYADQLAARGDFADALERLAEDGTREVILSGGDPLSLGNDRLASLLERLAALPALRRARIHTRFPIVLPDRVDAGLVALLERTRLGRVIVLHANHPREIDASVADALAALRSAGVTLLNQAVLLRGVNDDADTLAELSERLFECGVLPYYLHLLDAVAGAAHFDVEEPRAEGLYRELLARLPGYLVPRLVREIPGRASKTPIRPGL